MHDLIVGLLGDGGKVQRGLQSLLLPCHFCGSTCNECCSSDVSKGNGAECGCYEDFMAWTGVVVGIACVVQLELANNERAMNLYCLLLLIMMMMLLLLMLFSELC